MSHQSNQGSYWVKISNQGEVDINGFHLMGVTDKRQDDEKIGFFGSGNKYSVALLLRKRIPFKIFTGEKQIEIDTKPVMFKGQLFDRVLIEGEPTSLTTAMGPKWETWFAIREFYCNALDEGEEKIEVVDKIEPEPDKTTIFIALTEELGDFFRNINQYILVNKEAKETLMTAHGEISILEGDEYFNCYRKGIRIYPKTKEKSLYHYNFQMIGINESRIYQYEYQVRERIASCLAVCEDREIILNYLKNWKGKYEARLNWDNLYVIDKLSKTWHSLLRGKRVYSESVATRSGDFEGKANSYIVSDALADKIAAEISSCEVVGRRNGKFRYTIIKPMGDTKKKVDEALNLLGCIGYTVTSEVKVTKPEIDDVVGWYDKDKDTIFLAEEHITTVMSTANTLLEEHFHSKGFVDGQRAFVTYLIDLLINEKLKGANLCLKNL